MSNNRLIMMVIDGLREDACLAHMGYLAHLVEQGIASRYRVRSELPSLSRPLYEVLFTGTPVSVNGITSNQTVRLSNMASLFHLARENGRVTAAAAYYWVSELYNGAPFDYIQDREQEDVEKPIQFGRFYFDDRYPDSHLLIDAEHIRQKHHPDFLLIHPMGVDDTGHRYGGNSKEYHAKVSEMDVILSHFIPKWMELGYQILVTSDHGMNDEGMHGGTGETERMVPLLIISPKVAPGVYTKRISQLQIAPLVCRLLEIPPSPAMKYGEISEFPGLRTL